MRPGRCQSNGTNHHTSSNGTLVEVVMVCAYVGLYVSNGGIQWDSLLLAIFPNLHVEFSFYFSFFFFGLQTPMLDLTSPHVAGLLQPSTAIPLLPLLLFNNTR